MKLIRAEFHNFRLLRDLRLDFSTDPDRPLTVIRAENESGKTTILTALQWALYGDDALPGRNQDYRLHPIDWDIASEGDRVPISVQVDFEVTRTRNTPKGLLETRRTYRIIRSTFETVRDNGFERSPSTVKLFELTDIGAEPQQHPEVLLRELLPPELREVFFTDGDRALSFIEATVSRSTKRERVQRAIKSLLGLEVIENAQRHVRNAASAINREAQRIGSGQNLEKIAARLDEIERLSADLEIKVQDAKSQFATFDEKVAELERRIDAALRKGNLEELVKKKEHIRRQLEQLRKRREAAQRKHSDLFRSLSLCRDLLSSVFATSLAKLDQLHAQGQIPNATIPVLEERLKQPTCFCGESLDDSDPAGKRRREHIQALIAKSLEADELLSRVTDLYYAAKPLYPDKVSAEERWTSEYAAVAEERDDVELLIDEQEKELRALEIKIASIPSTDIQGLRTTLQQFREQRDRFNREQARLETELEHLQRERERLVAQRDNLLREQRRGARILAELQVTQDVEQVLNRAYDRLTKEELKKVSNLMNALFLEMIGADPDQGSIIKRAEVSDEFDIVVYGPQNRTLDPDRDLNGASRRALTLAFILALTKVSEVEAPNVIDTPLGMMSGYVKQSVLRTAIRESSQLILFLTRSEISGCEEILDEKAGCIVTLTNPAHYPRMLVNDPGVVKRTLLRCDCDHRSECALCQRVVDTEVDTAVEISA